LRHFASEVDPGAERDARDRIERTRRVPGLEREAGFVFEEQPGAVVVAVRRIEPAWLLAAGR
jgi:hypothetical protein